MLSTAKKVAQVLDLSDQDYFGSYDKYVTAHKLIKYSRDPVGFFDTKEEEPPLDNLVVGAAVHKLALEGERAFQDEYCVIGDDLVETKGGRFVGRKSKAWHEACMSRGWATDKVLRHSEFLRIDSMARAFRRSEYAGYLEGSRVEVTMRWQMWGLDCQAKADILCGRNEAIVDLKTTSDVGGFEASVYRYGYDVQAAWYSLGYQACFGKTPRFIFVLVEKQEPWTVKEYQLDFFQLQQAHTDVEYWAKRLQGDIEARREG